MNISAINGINTIKANPIQANNTVQKNTAIQKEENQNNKNSIPLSNYGKAMLGLNKKYNPSFGFDLFTLGMIGYGLVYAGVIGLAVYKTDLDEKRRAEENERLTQQTEDSINSIEKELRVTRKQAEEYHYNFLRQASIPLKNDGDEIGLNAVQGYGPEKYKLAMEVIAPIVAASKDKYCGYSKGIPNGVLLYGPTGGGKTYIADKVCEHLDYLGIPVVSVELDESNHSQNVRNIQKAFAKAEENYKNTKKITVVKFEQDVDNFFLDRRNNPECIREVRALLKNAEKCADRGVVWIGTSNNPQMMDAAILRPGRTDFKLAIGDMEDFAVSDMIKYTLYKYGEDISAQDFDYKKVIDMLKDNSLAYTPAELELFVSNAQKHKKDPEEKITAEMVMDEISEYQKNDFPSLSEEIKTRFVDDINYIAYLDQEEAIKREQEAIKAANAEKKAQKTKSEKIEK